MNMYGKNMYSKGGMAKNPKKMAMGGDVMTTGAKKPKKMAMGGDVITTGVTRGTGAARKQTFRIY
jgi:hypothetical protein